MADHRTRDRGPRHRAAMPTSLDGYGAPLPRRKPLESKKEWSHARELTREQPHLEFPGREVIGFHPLSLARSLRCLLFSSTMVLHAGTNTH